MESNPNDGNWWVIGKTKGLPFERLFKLLLDMIWGGGNMTRTSGKVSRWRQLKLNPRNWLKLLFVDKRES